MKKQEFLELAKEHDVYLVMQIGGGIYKQLVKDPWFLVKHSEEVNAGVSGNWLEVYDDNFLGECGECKKHEHK